MKNIWIYVMIAVAVAVLVLIMWPKPSQAAPDGWPQSEWSKPVIIKQPVRRVHKRKRRSVKRRKAAVAAAKFENLNGFICSRPVTVTGQVKATEKRAQDSAWSQYHSSIKFALGERYADERFARDVRWQCIRSRSESLVAKTVDAVGGSVDRFRCSMSARPCQPPRE